MGLAFIAIPLLTFHFGRPGLKSCPWVQVVPLPEIGGEDDCGEGE